MRGVVWFDPTTGKSEHCFGWHQCCFEEAHDGDHMCVDGHFCPQETKHAEKAQDSTGD